MREIVLIAFITTLTTGCIRFLPGYGGGDRKNISAISAITVTAVTTLTRHITAEADSITETTIIPVTTITLSMTTTRKAIIPNIRRIIRTNNMNPNQFFLPTQSHKGERILIIDRKFPHVVIKIDRMSKALFRLFHAAPVTLA